MLEGGEGQEENGEGVRGAVYEEPQVQVELMCPTDSVVSDALGEHEHSESRVDVRVACDKMQYFFLFFFFFS